MIMISEKGLKVNLSTDHVTKIKTFYIGFHDGRKHGEEPQTQYEPGPLIKIDISHHKASEIVNYLYRELKEIANQEEIIKTTDKPNKGYWP